MRIMGDRYSVLIFKTLPFVSYIHQLLSPKINYFKKYKDFGVFLEFRLNLKLKGEEMKV